LDVVRKTDLLDIIGGSGQWWEWSSQLILLFAFFHRSRLAQIWL